MALATGQFTIVDHNDATTLTGFISSNKSKTQAHNPDTDTYVPNFTLEDPLVLKASIFIAGSSDDVLESGDNVTDMQWSVNKNGTWENIVGATTREHKVTANLTDVSSKEFRFHCTYNDIATGLPLEFNATIEIHKVRNGTGIADATITAVDGNVFKNNNVPNLKAECQLWRGSAVATNLTTEHFKWFKQKPGGEGNALWGVPAGWEEIVSGHIWDSIKKASVLTVTNDMVINTQPFMCSVDDPESEVYFKDVITFIDQTDPIQIVIESSGGSIFKNGLGSSTLKAKLYQNGTEIDPEGTVYNYSWIKYDKSGSQESEWTKTGKNISVTDVDVDVKATFMCTISAK